MWPPVYSTHAKNYGMYFICYSFQYLVKAFWDPKLYCNICCKILFRVTSAKPKYMRPPNSTTHRCCRTAVLCNFSQPTPAFWRQLNEWLRWVHDRQNVSLNPISNQLLSNSQYFYMRRWKASTLGRSWSWDRPGRDYRYCWSAFHQNAFLFGESLIKRSHFEYILFPI